ncbi:MAG: hypothetical protein IJ888_06480 [Prevotella sp.]|nr:hypothetical protein [Prevotella sp.]
MKKLMNLSKLAIAALVTSSLFVACSEEISENTVDTKYTPQTGNISNAGQAVDLGLPSGTLWANKNVGASNESDNGILFIWGDATGQKIDANNDATYTDVIGATSFEDLFNAYSSETKTDGNLCDTTKIAQISQPKLIDTSGLTDPAEIKDKVVNYLKAKLDEYKASSTGEGLLEVTLVNDDSWMVIMNLDKGEYFERIPGDADPVEYYAGYKCDKVSSLSAEEIIIKQVTYETSSLANNYSDVKDELGTVIRKDYTGGTIGNSIKDITDDGKKNNLTFVPAYYIFANEKYDAATANWGHGWRMPTTAELAELLNYCEWEFTGTGYKVTGPNGNSIFLPAAGYRYGDKLYGNGNSGYYASGEIIGTYSYPSMKAQSEGSFGEFSSKENMPSVLMFQQGQYNSISVGNNMSSSYGFSIRPVAILLK